MWVADKDRDRCSTCGKIFTTMRRRHHCRGCGEIFCAEHAQKFDGHFGMRRCTLCRSHGPAAVRRLMHRGAAKKETSKQVSTECKAPSEGSSPGASGGGNQEVYVATPANDDDDEELHDEFLAATIALAESQKSTSLTSAAEKQQQVVLDSDVEGRAAIAAFLSAAGIGTRPGYKPAISDIIDYLVDFGVRQRHKKYYLLSNLDA